MSKFINLCGPNASGKTREIREGLMEMYPHEEIYKTPPIGTDAEKVNGRYTVPRAEPSRVVKIAGSLQYIWSADGHANNEGAVRRLLYVLRRGDVIGDMRFATNPKVLTPILSAGHDIHLIFIEASRDTVAYNLARRSFNAVSGRSKAMREGWTWEQTIEWARKEAKSAKNDPSQIEEFERLGIIVHPVAYEELEPGEMNPEIYHLLTCVLDILPEISKVLV